VKDKAEQLYRKIALIEHYDKSSYKEGIGAILSAFSEVARAQRKSDIELYDGLGYLGINAPLITNNQ